MANHDPNQLRLWSEDLYRLETDEDKDVSESVVETGAIISLDIQPDSIHQSSEEQIERPALPARWEAAYHEAEHRNVTPMLLQQVKRVEAMDFLEHLVALSKDEGYVWVVYGASGSGKSAFFHTLEYQTREQVRTHIINADDSKVQISNHISFSDYLRKTIERHKEKHGNSSPLVIVLEQREQAMTTEERASIGQALRNVLRPPGPGRNVVFVFPVIDSYQGSLFLDQVQSIGVSIPVGHNAIYNFHGPPHTEHVDILTNLFTTLNDRDISDFGIQRSHLQAHVSSQKTIGEYIRLRACL